MDQESLRIIQNLCPPLLNSFNNSLATVKYKIKNKIQLLLTSDLVFDNSMLIFTEDIFNGIIFVMIFLSLNTVNVTEI